VADPRRDDRRTQKISYSSLGNWSIIASVNVARMKLLIIMPSAAGAANGANVSDGASP
jgi:hypothetical protein